VLEATSLLAEQFGFAAGVLRALWVLAGFGLILTLILAWYHGEKGAQRVSGPELIIITILLGIAGGVLWVINRPEIDTGVPTSGSAVRGEAASPEVSPYLASIAVLPLQNLGPAEDRYLGQGFADELITQLAQIPRLKVSSWTSVSALEGANLTLPEIADTLGVDHILEGSIRRSGHTTRITVQLIEARTDAHLWASSFDRELDNLFEVQEEIAQQTLSALFERVPGLRPTSAGSRTSQGEAYQAYLQGRYAVHHRTREDLSEAIESFAKAIRIDPGFAPAYSGLGAAYGLWLRYGYPSEIGEYRMAGQALAAVDYALSLDPENGEAYAARAWVKTLAWAPLEEIDADFRKALALLPNSTDAHGWHGHYLVRAGMFGGALAEATKAIELDPLAPGRRVGLSIDALGMGRFDLAVQEAERALTLEPSLDTAEFSRGIALLLLGRYGECLEAEVGPHLAVRAMCLSSLDRTDEAAEIVDDLASAVEAGNTSDLSVSRSTVIRDLSVYFAWVGEIEESLRYLDLAFEGTPYGVDFRLWASGVYDRVTASPQSALRYTAAAEEAWNRVAHERDRASPGIPESLF
jgi:TolB-like protein